MPNPLTDPQRQAIEAAIVAEQKIQAIKLYREATGAGLADSKGAVEKTRARDARAAPGEFWSQTRSHRLRRSDFAFGRGGHGHRRCATVWMVGYFAVGTALICTSPRSPTEALPEILELRRSNAGN